MCFVTATKLRRVNNGVRVEHSGRMRSEVERKTYEPEKRSNARTMVFVFIPRSFFFMKSSQYSVVSVNASLSDHSNCTSDILGTVIV